MRLRWLYCGILILLLMQFVTAACWAGHYALAYWRELGKHENSANHSIYVHVFDENGNPKSGVQLKTTWNVLLGTTDVNGYSEITVDVNNSKYEIICVDAQGSTSDVSPWMTSRRWPEWGHYSYNLAFMYKTSQSNPGTFDTDLVGTINLPDSNESDAPATKSLTYYSTNPLDRESDAYYLGNGSAFFGQTFVANADRIVACKIQATTGFGNHLRWSAQILSGGPNGTAIGPVRTSREMVSDEFHPILITWGVDDVPVVPGQTYFLKVWNTAGTFLNVWYCGNNYPSGQYYEGATPNSSKDIKGLVVAMDYASASIGAISGTVRDASTSQVIPGATVITSPATQSATTDGNGIYTINNVPQGIYNVTASKAGYHSQTQTSKTVVAGQTTTVNFNLTPIATTPIGQAKGIADYDPVAVKGIVTAQFPVGGTQNKIYIEAADRSSGIAVATPTAVALGSEVLVQGTMRTSDGERYVYTGTVDVLSTGQAVPDALAVTNRDLGGGQFHLQSAVLDDSDTNTYSACANNVGSLVRSWGRVTYVDTSGAYFYMDDGSEIADGSGRTGVRVATAGLPSPTANTFVVIRGISGATIVNGKVVRLLRPRSTGDLSYANLMNYVTNPGFETGTLSSWTIYGAVDGVQSSGWFAGISAHSGSKFLGNAASGGTKNGGIYQRIAVPAGSSYQAKAWSIVYRGDNAADSAQNKIGIDPTGGTSPTAATVQWSSIDTQPADYLWEWHELNTPTAVCTGGYVTVFLDMKQINNTGWHINCFDDTALYMVGL